jgi:excisionase family DNA binding protein
MRREDTPIYLSTVQAAESLGVSVSTIKRWVDEGVLPAHRTAGGHRKLLRSEVLSLARQGTLPVANLGTLHVPLPNERSLDTDGIVESLLTALLQGHSAEVTGIIRQAYNSGLSISTLADRVISPVMNRVGHEWETGRIDIWKEHRASQMCAAALYELKDKLELRAEQNRPVAVGGAPADDPYVLPTVLAQLVLLDEGWETVQLGCNTPLPSMIKALQELHPRLLWLSVTYLKNPQDFREQYLKLFAAAEKEGTAVIIGGQALAEGLRVDLPYTSFGDKLSHLASFARTLNPRPRRPRRGRPSGTRESKQEDQE